MTLLFIDFETYFNSKAGYDLRKISLVEYIRDPRFKAWGVAVCEAEGSPYWIRHDDLEEWIATTDWDKTTLIAHNAKFDVSVLRRIGGEILGLEHIPQFLDTKAMARAVLGKSVENYALRTLAAHYGLEPKGELKIDGLERLDEAQEAALSEYCRHDVALCREIYRRTFDEFPGSQLPHLDWTIRSFVYPRLVVDTGVLDAAVKEEKARKAAVFRDIGRPKEDFSSNVKFAALLAAGGYRVPTKRSLRTGEDIPALALGDTAFLDLLESDDLRLRKLCEARVEAKSTILETRCAKLSAVGSTGPWPFDVEFSGAAQTHRYSGGGGAAGNPQNFVRDSALREAISAPGGFRLVVGDFAAIEMRLVAFLANDPALTLAIGAGKDVYCEFASAFYGRPITKADKAERWFGKTAILGLGYGMGAAKFAHTVRVQTGQRISDSDARKAVALYRSKFYRVPQLWSFLDNQIVRLARGESGALGSLPVKLSGGNITLPSGLKIQYPGLEQMGVTRFGKPEWAYDTWGNKNTKEKTKLYGGKVLENITQALAGELAKEVNSRFMEHLVGVCHDEVLLSVPAADVHTYRQKLEAAMVVAPVWLPKLKLACEVGIGKNWREAKAA